MNFKLALKAVGMLVARRPYGPLCRATRPDGTFTVRALTSAEGSSMMNDYMGINKGDAAETMSHSLMQSNNFGLGGEVWDGRAKSSSAWPSLHKGEFTRLLQEGPVGKTFEGIGCYAFEHKERPVPT